MKVLGTQQGVLQLLQKSQESQVLRGLRVLGAQQGIPQLLQKSQESQASQKHQCNRESQASWRFRRRTQCIV